MTVAACHAAGGHAFPGRIGACHTRGMLRGRHPHKGNVTLSAPNAAGSR